MPLDIILTNKQLEPTFLYLPTKIPWQISRIRNNIPGQGHGNVLVIHQTIPIVPEIIFSVHRSVVQQGILASQDNFVPQNNLKQNLDTKMQQLRVDRTTHIKTSLNMFLYETCNSRTLRSGPDHTGHCSSMTSSVHT